MSEERSNLVRNMQHVPDDVDDVELIEESSLPPSDISSDTSINAVSLSPPLRKRGRPATGKRSDPNWIGRTYYVKRETDLDVEGMLFQLKRRGIEIDKSELVNSLLRAWVSWQESDTTPFPVHDVLPHKT